MLITRNGAVEWMLPSLSACTAYVTLGELVNPSLPEFPHLQKESPIRPTKTFLGTG